MKVIVLLSGGMDSATALYWAKSKGFQCRALSFDYGQRHTVEIGFAQKLARRAGCAWDLVRFRLPWTRTSSLLNLKKAVPHHTPGRIGLGGIPSTYVPARNTIFLSFALAACDATAAGAIVIGANAIDYSGYPDCRPAYFSAMKGVVRTGTQRGVEGRAPRILTPLLHLDKRGIVRLGTRLAVPFELTWSCYGGRRAPCQQCDACLLRARGFREADLEDPLLK